MAQYCRSPPLIPLRSSLRSLRTPYITDYPLLPPNTQQSSPHIIDLDAIAHMGRDIEGSLDHFEISMLDTIVTVLYKHDLEQGTRKLVDFLDVGNVELFQYEWRREGRNWGGGVFGMFIWRFREIIQIGETQSIHFNPALRITNRAWYRMPPHIAHFLRTTSTNTTNKKPINADPWVLTSHASHSTGRKWQYDLDVHQQAAIHCDFPNNPLITEEVVKMRNGVVARKWIKEMVWKARERSNEGGGWREGIDIPAIVVVYGAPMGLRDPIRILSNLTCFCGYFHEDVGNGVEDGVEGEVEESVEEEVAERVQEEVEDEAEVEDEVESQVNAKVDAEAEPEVEDKFEEQTKAWLASLGW